MDTNATSSDDDDGATSANSDDATATSDAPDDDTQQEPAADVDAGVGGDARAPDVSADDTPLDDTTDADSADEADDVDDLAEAGASEPVDAGPADTMPEMNTDSPEAGATAAPEAAPPPVMGTSVWSFDSNIQGWAVGASDPTSIGDGTTLSFSASEGSPEIGALRAAVPFTGGNEKVLLQVKVASLDLRGKTLSARVLADRGLSPDTANRSRIKLFVKTGGSFLYAAGPDLMLVPGSPWATVTFDVDQPDYVDPNGTYDASDVREVGFELNSGETGGAINGAVLYLDSIDY
jgi:hypothetical protein